MNFKENDTQIAVLVKKESGLRSRISALSKNKGSAEECRHLTIDTERCVRERLFLEALNRLSVGSQVTGCYHRKKEVGRVVGYQMFGDRIVGLWVEWNGSRVQMPEDPTLLELQR